MKALRNAQNSGTKNTRGNTHGSGRPCSPKRRLKKRYLPITSDSLPSALNQKYWIAGLYQGGEVPEGLELYTFPAGSWAVFTAIGPIPAALQELNTAVWQEWFPTDGQKYQANGTATLEVYSVGDPQSPAYESGIWVPIKED